LFPLILGCYYAFLRFIKASKKQIFFLSICTFITIPFILRFFIASKFEVDQFWLGVKILKVVIYRLDGIALGLLAAFLKFWYPVLWHKSRNISFLIGICLSYLILYSSWPPNAFSTKVILIAISSLGCFFLLPKFDSMKTAPKFITKIFTHISLISYSMYLINLGLVSQVLHKNIQIAEPITAWAVYIIYWGIVIIVSTLLYKFYEKPIMDLRDKIKFKKIRTINKVRHKH
jgi:peptidoglycan/LPS O-acetylase OafA/YrhL